MTEIEIIRQGIQHEKSRLKYLRDVTKQANQVKNLKVQQLVLMMTSIRLQILN